MIRLSGFADEIGPDLKLQIDTLRSEGIRFIELRGVGGKNVLDFTDAERKEIKQRLDDAGMAISAIGSPIGKVEIDKPWADHVARFKIPPKGGRIGDHRDEVIRRLNEQVRMAQGRRTRLLHENEKDIYGEKTAECLDIARNVKGMDLIFDPANFVQVGVKPAEAWPVLKDHVVYFHIKDALLGSGKVVPAGEGDGAVEAILRDAIKVRRYDGFLSLEPHLAAAEQFYGFSGPDLFTKAIHSLKAILDRLEVKYA